MIPVTNDDTITSKPLISVCIPAFNAQSHIGSCLGSLASQTFQDIEIIVIDDGSDEPLSLDECLFGHISEERVHLERTENHGTYAARQRAALLARGEYLFFVDADDELFGNSALAKLAMVIATYASDVILFNAVSESGVHLVDYEFHGWHGELEPSKFLREMAVQHTLNSLCCIAFRRELLVADKVAPRLCYAEDRLQKFEIIQRARNIWVTDEPIYLYKEVSTSTTHARYKPEYYLQACHVEERISKYFDGLGVDWAAWAEGFFRMTSGHLISLVNDDDMVRHERLDTYMLFREQSVCEVAFARMKERRMGARFFLWVELFRKQHFGLLDSLMTLRSFAGK